MGLYRLTLFLIWLLPTSALLGLDSPADLEKCRHHILFVSNTGRVTESIQLYRDYIEKTGYQDFDLLNQMCLAIMNQGARSEDPELNLLSFFGAGICLSEDAVPILETGLLSDNPQLQIVCLNFLSGIQHDRADQTIKLLFRAPNPIIQLEAAFCLAKKKHPHALSQTEALMAKFPASVKVVFPTIFSCIGTPRANSILRQLLNDPDEKVRIESVLTAMEFDRDDFLPQIRRLAKHTGPLQQEACAMALGHFRDEKSAAHLETLIRSSSPYVIVAAAHALYCMGRKQYGALLVEAAKDQFPFSVYLLKDVKEAKGELLQLTMSPSPDTRLNAATALLAQRDSRCVPPMKSVLTASSHKLIVKAYSPSKALMFLKYVTPESLGEEQAAVAVQISNGLKSKLLEEAMNLPEPDFLELADAVMHTANTDLIPRLVRLLENVHSPASIALLKKYQQKIGAPLVRNYCNLALFRIRESGPYEENLRQWVREQYHLEMIQFSPFMPFQMRLEEPSYQLTPSQSSAFYVEALEALTKSQEEKDVMMLLEAMEKGNPKNRYALAGLLMRAIQ